MSVEDIFEQYYNKIGEAMPSAKGAGFPGSAIIDTNGVKCCKRKSLINDGGEVVCKFCGQVSHYEMVNEGFIDYYENLYRIKRKSKYQRKYHI